MSTPVSEISQSDNSKIHRSTKQLACVVQAAAETSCRPPLPRELQDKDTIVRVITRVLHAGPEGMAVSQVRIIIREKADIPFRILHWREKTAFESRSQTLFFLCFFTIFFYNVNVFVAILFYYMKLSDL
jgi:hypothetical protein